MYLAAFDFDSTLIQQEIIDELAHRAGKGAEVSAITHAAMAGSIPYEESLRRRVALLEGLGESDLQAVADSIAYRHGFLQLMAHLKQRRFKIAVISGTFAAVIERLPHRDQFDAIHVNDVVLDNGRLTGDVLVRVTNNKGDVLEALQQQYGIPPERTVSVGDGVTDVGMFERSGFSVAFNAKPSVRARATLALDGDSLLPLQAELERIFFQRPAASPAD